ncbi:MAG: hypothetical protein FJ295_05635 [Planctomycetes bacterium]|nr:hypothetical protein [Planctomycetota bacterium]
MKVQFTRALRTSSSERYLIHIDGTGDDAALDLHYLADGTVAGTLIVLDKQYASKEMVAVIVEEIDRMLLPSVSVTEGNLSFTVVKGSVIGTFTAQADE